MSKRAAQLTSFLLLYGLVGAAAAFDPNTDPSLIGWWKLDDGSGNVAADASGHGRDGTVRGDPPWIQGYFGGGLLLDGTNDYVEVSTPLNLRSNHVTITAWVNLNGRQSEWSGIVVSRAGSTICGLHYGPAGELRYNWNDVTWGWVSGLPMPDQEWFFTAVVVEPTKATLYLNKQSAVNAMAHDIEEFDSTLVIGQDPLGGRFLRGMVDDVRIFDRSLSAAEVKAMVPPRLKAYKPSPADGAIGVTMALLQWTKGETALFHDVYLGTSPELTAADRTAARQGFPMYFHGPGLMPGVTYYWRVDEIEAGGTVYQGDVWSFTVMPLSAYLPQPADGAASVLLSPTLSWAAGQMAIAHHVYFGADRQAVEEGAAGADKGSLGATETSYKVAESLKPDTTYYWRVDETDSGGTIHAGPIWSFSTVPPGPVGAVRQWWSNVGSGTTVADLTNNGDFPDRPTGSEFVTLMEGPVNWSDNYGSRIYGWLYPPQSGDYTFWISSDDGGELWLSTDADPANKKLIATVATWTDSREWGKEASQRSLPVELEAGSRYYIEALMKEGGGGDNVAVAWQGPGIAMDVIGAGGVGPTPFLPVRAYSPSPADGAVDTVQTITLTWNAGEKAQKHEVYFGDDANAVAAADSSTSLFKGSQSGTSYDAGALEWGETYYWRVDEINTGEAESPWVGRVWSFTTANFLPVDDFESYTDEEGVNARIYENWIDGYADQSSGSIVGNFDPPFAERTIVHGGKQSMPMEYDNSVPPYYSEAYREFAPTQNWTVNGVDTLSLWVQGQQAALAPIVETAGQMTVTGGGTDIWNNSDQFTYVYKTLSGDGSLIARVVSIGAGSNTWAKGGVMVRGSLDADSNHAMMVITANSDGTAGNGASFQYRLDVAGASANSDSPTVVAPPYWVKIERTGSTVTGSYSADGKTWAVVGTPQFLMLGSPAYIGLCVTSHVAGAYRTVEFDNVKATGAGGAWATKEIGLARNSVQNLYVVVEDSAGKKAVATDPNVVNATTWTEVKFPLSSLAGVNLAKVKRLYLGVGDRDNPTPDGTGKIYIDDIRVTRP
jgi:hypothetical protein